MKLNVVIYNILFGFLVKMAWLLALRLLLWIVALFSFHGYWTSIGLVLSKCCDMWDWDFKTIVDLICCCHGYLDIRLVISKRFLFFVLSYVCMSISLYICTSNFRFQISSIFFYSLELIYLDRVLFYFLSLILRIISSGIQALVVSMRFLGIK